MARNGAGTYNLPSGNPVVTGSTISSTWANSTLNDIATALTGSISSDGQTTPTGNLPMGNYAHTGVADATVRTMYGTAGQIQDSAFTYLTSPSGTNTMIATAALGMSAYVTGQRFFFLAPSTNTGACTLNINAIGAKAITKQGTTALSAGDIVSGAVVQVVYDGTQFQLLNPTALPSGVITLWSGSIASIPGGWYLCNGSNGTPDLRNMFVVGAGSTYAVAATGGSADSITVAHTHTYSGTTSTQAAVQLSFGYAPGSSTSGISYGVNSLTVTGNASTGVITDVPAHSHTYSGTTASTGSSGTNANLPPYYALAYIMKA
jgi:hypothetical protein